jgi:hypothetical protein
MGREDVLLRLLDSRRLALPPNAGYQPGPPDPDDTTFIEWHPDGLFVYDLAGSIEIDGSPGLSGGLTLEFSFLGVGAEVAQARLVPDGNAVVRRPSGTVLRTKARTPASGTIQPVSAAVSPYLGLDFQPSVPAAPQERLLLAVSELVAFDVLRQQVISVATKVWDPATASGPLDPLIRSWCQEVQSRLAADSPVAVIRLREIHDNPPPPDHPDGPPDGVTVVYRFLASDPVIMPLSPARRAPALRAQPASIRQAQGQYAGPARPPDALVPFEVAPPQIVGVQPIRLDSRPGTAGGTTWPWGLAAYRISVLQTAGGVGIAGPVLTLPPQNSQDKPVGRLWWHSLHQAVPYFVPDGPAGRRILPTFFRAKALPGLLPAWPSWSPPAPGLLPPWPASPLPAPQEIRDALAAQDDEPEGTTLPIPASSLTGWQPVLPGAHVVLLAGARTGAAFAFRDSIQTQDLGAGRAVVSGSVPVMHRPPRPNLLPPNDPSQPEIALQTSAGAFALDKTVVASSSPADAAFLDTAPSPKGLDLVLFSPDPPTPGRSIANGIIPAGPKDNPAVSWDGTLRFQADSHGSDLADWFQAATATLDVTDNTTGNPKSFTFKPSAIPGTPPTAGTILFAPDDLAGIQTWLAKTAHSDEAKVRVSVGVDAAPTDVKNFRQTLSFPLHVAYDQGVNALPYRPSFALFEDPQYNRRLGSITAQQAAIATVIEGGNPLTYNLTLSADRHEYNATGPIHYLFFFDPSDLNGTATGDFQFQKIGRDGNTTSLTTVANVPANSLPTDPKSLDLSFHCSGNPLVPGDTLVITLTVHVAGTALTNIAVLNLPIVAEPVNPVPEAGYALLRMTNPDGLVECVCFAFSPEAARIELTNPNDLRQQNVRRRAVFLWRDTPRIGRDVSYAVQKITTGGSTHFPAFPNRDTNRATGE